MTVKSMHNVGIVVADLDAAIEFFNEFSSGSPKNSGGRHPDEHKRDQGHTSSACGR
jgi:catechol 2,3-dioxygenase-like lactoylglutathione lyase family enzyme